MTDGLTIITHYPKTDTRKDGDYYDVEVNLHKDGKHYRLEFGDSYHEKGSEKADAIEEFCQVLFGSKFPVIRYSVADREE